jgi:hypothetical protein
MNPSSDPPDPFLQSLAEEAASLPGLAAQEARRSTIRRGRRRRQIASVAVMMAVAACAWQIFRTAPMRRHEPRPELPPSAAVAANAVPAPSASSYVKVQTMQEAMADPLPIPAGLDKEQRDLVEAARGLPLLLVKDASGKVTRIHVVER